MYAKNLDSVAELWLPPDPEAEKRYYKYKDEKFDTRGPYRIKPLDASKSMDRRDNLVFPIKAPSGKEIWPKRQWWWSQERTRRALENNELVFTGEGDQVSVSYKQYLRDETGKTRGAKPFSIIDGIYTQHGTDDLSAAFSGKLPMQFPKPVDLIRKLIELGCEKESNDLILDFFAGSGTLAEAVMQANLQGLANERYILVQIGEKTGEESAAHKLGCKTIADVCSERITRISKKLREEVKKNPRLFGKHEVDLGFKAFKLEQSTFKIWRTDTIESEEDLNRQMEVFENPVRARSMAENIAWEILLKSGYELTTKLEKIDLGGIPIYSIADGEVFLVLERITEAAIDTIGKRKPRRVICLDRLFEGNDQLKTNTALQMKDAGVEFVAI